MRRLLVAVLVLAMCLPLAGCGTAAPDVQGMMVNQATEVIKSAGFQVGQITYDETSTEATGSVIAQTPEAGKRGKTGSLVILTVAGPPPVPVPELSGLDKGKAEAALIEGSLVLGDVTESYDASIPSGAVTTQTPAPGVILDRGLAVAVVLSKGPEPVAIPSVKGKTEAEAKSLLQAAGFKVEATKKNDKAAKGTVIAVSPSTPTALPGAQVVITVSTGVEMVKVPNVINMYSSDAKARLSKAGLKGKDVFIHGPIDSDSGNADFGKIYRQTPRAGTSVPRGTTVEIRSWWEMG